MYKPFVSHVLVEADFQQVVGIAEGLKYLHELKPQVIHGDLRAVRRWHNMPVSISFDPLSHYLGQCVDL